MELFLSRSFSIPTVNLKPLLFVSLAGVTAVSVYSSLVIGESEGKARLKSTLTKVITPLIDAAKETGKGLSSLYSQLSNWAKSIANQKDSFLEWMISSDSFPQKMHDGTRLIFEKIKDWAEKLITEATPALWELLKDPEKLRDKIYYFTPFAWHTFSALSSSGTGGSFMFNFANMVGNKNFGAFAKVLGNHQELLKDGNKAQELLYAFQGNSEKAVEALEKLQGENLNKALKTLSLVGKIKEANSEALVLVEKGKLGTLTPQEKQKGTKLKEKMQTLQKELEETIDKAKKELEEKKRNLQKKK